MRGKTITLYVYRPPESVAPKGTTLVQVASAAFPFLICDTVLVGFMIVYPQFVLWLPNLMH